MDTPSTVDAVRVGFASVSVDPGIQEQALENLHSWLEDARFVMYRAQLMSMIDRQCWTELLDSFYQELPFGTGGRRGRVGIGPNRFNPWTLSSSIQAHAQWLQALRGESGLSVVIGYDVRMFSDFGRTFAEDLPSPLHGVTSRHFAEIAAEIYAAYEITVYIPPADQVLSTPELSFAVRALQADGGLVISASHNPPDDNGSKFYHHHGGQLVPPFDEQLGTYVQQAQRIERMSIDRAIANGLVREIPTTVHTEYIAANLRIAKMPEERAAAIVFSPLHGTGDTTVSAVLQEAGFSCVVEPTQAKHDGRFPAVPFRTPNPELAHTLDAAIQTANHTGANLVMACDPDADRLGVGVLHQDEWIILSGNEIASLVCMAALEEHPHTEPLVFKTEVTSNLVTRIAESQGAQVVDDLLVGFKYIGEAMYLLERKNRFRHHEGTLDRFAVGVEESHGVLVHSALRDKDAAGGALLLAELASRESKHGRSLIDTLHELLLQHGVFYNHTTSTIMQGVVGRRQMHEILASYRTSPPTHIGDKAVLQWSDKQSVEGPLGPIQSQTERDSRNMLVFELEDCARVILRPSGTEAKAKIYVETMSTAETLQDVVTVQKQMEILSKQLANAFCIDMLNRVGISLPEWAMEISELVSIEDKINWSTELVPQLLQKIQQDPENAIHWLHETLEPASRALLLPGIKAFSIAWDGNKTALLDCFET